MLPRAYQPSPSYVNALTVVGQIAAGLGSAGAPAYSYTGDTNTGAYSPGADQWAVATGGAQRLLVDSGGDLSIITGDLRLSGSGATLQALTWSGTTLVWGGGSNWAQHQWSIAGSVALTLNSSGLGVGAAPPSNTKFYVVGGVASADNAVVAAPSTSTSITADFATLAVRNTGAATTNAYSSIQFEAQNSTPVNTVYSGIFGVVINKTAGAEAGSLLFATRTGGGALVGRWRVNESGHLTAESDNAYDIGASGSNRPRNVYVAGTVTAGAFSGPLTGNVTGNCSGSAGSVAASALTGSTLAAGVTASSLTSVGTLAAGTTVYRLVHQSSGSFDMALTLSTGTTVGASFHFGPNGDNTYDLGQSSFKWRDVYCNRGAFNGSHSSLKRNFSPLMRGEALTMARSLVVGRYQYKPTDEKDTGADRWHTGYFADALTTDERLTHGRREVDAQTTASTALAAVADEADAREADVKKLRAEIARLDALLKEKLN